MDVKCCLENMREKTRRPVRNRRYNRRAYGEEKRPPKRLFTPEIKRFLKDWLVRRRDNPYPNRDEKKMLSAQTGLTYIQVCNWFANWRRKLKNVGREPQRKTWGDLIKTYNTQVQGNVEHFSICSEDSIWDELETEEFNSVEPYHNDDNHILYNNNDIHNQCFYVSSTTTIENPFSQTRNSQYNMEQCDNNNPISDECKTSMISKWLESAANFKPSEESFLDWTLLHKNGGNQKKKAGKKVDNNLYLLHGREELDAAEALTTLANCNKRY